MKRVFDAILFDLFTGLLDSWSLWNQAAGDGQAGRRWRLRYLELCYAAGQYRPWESLVAEAAADVGLPGSVSADLVEIWDRLEPWAEVPEVLPRLGVSKLGVVTNCSESLAVRAAQRVPAHLAVVVSAERAGAYKPDPRPYQLALAELEIPPERVLFVAGSPSDIKGAARAGMRVFWHNRLGLSGEGDDRLLGESDSLQPLLDWSAPRWEDSPLVE